MNLRQIHYVFEDVNRLRMNNLRRVRLGRLQAQEEQGAIDKYTESTMDLTSSVARFKFGM